MGIQAISSVTVADPTLLAQLQSTSKASHSARPKAGGAPPAGGGGAKPAAASSASTSGSSTSKVYDKRDLNKDGTVSYEEQLLYSIQHPTEETGSQSAVSSNKLKTGLNAYKQDQQAGNTSLSSFLSAI